MKKNSSYGSSKQWNICRRRNMVLGLWLRSILSRSWSRSQIFRVNMPLPIRSGSKIKEDGGVAVEERWIKESALFLCQGRLLSQVCRVWPDPTLPRPGSNPSFSIQIRPILAKIRPVFHSKRTNYINNYIFGTCWCLIESLG